MFNKREKEFNDLINEAERHEATIRNMDILQYLRQYNEAKSANNGYNRFGEQLGMILAAPDMIQWVDAVRIALETLAAKLYGNGDRPKWTKIASAAVQIAAFVVTMIRSLKQSKK